MSTTEYTTEDQLVSDLVDYWQRNPPAGLVRGTAITSFRSQEVLPVPAVIIGHDGFTRETAKGMTGTGRVALQVVLRTDMDRCPAPDHHAQAAALDRALLAMATNPGPLALTHLHAFLREAPSSQVEDRRQLTALAYTVIATRMEE